MRIVMSRCPQRARAAIRHEFGRGNVDAVGVQGLKDQQATFVTRDMYSSIEKRVNDLEKKESRGEGGTEAQHGGRLQMNWNVSTLIALIALALVVINFIAQRH